MRIRRRILTLTGVIVGSLLVIVALATASPGFTAPPLVSGYSLPETLDNRFVLRTPPETTPVINADKALELAMEYAAGLATNPKDASVQYVEFTDTGRGIELADGTIQLEFVDVPAWIVRFRGVPQPVVGRHKANDQDQPQPQATELNVVLDARTGAYLEMFSFR
jgi:hypothetical protein